MDPKPAPSTPPSPHVVPEDLLKKLHEATDHFHDRKKQHEQVMQDNEYRHEERLEKSRDELQRAERELEKVTEEIKNDLDKPK